MVPGLARFRPHRDQESDADAPGSPGSARSETFDPPPMIDDGSGTTTPEWARRAIAVATGGLVVGYLLWRTTTVPLASPIGWLFYLLELHAALSLGLFLFSTWSIDDRPTPRESVRTPTVALCITTYDEDEHILLPTVAAAVALRPAHETWVLDDGRRPWVKEMAEQIGARYLTRSTNAHAKAGNLNHALAAIKTDLIAVLDADHVPSAEFLTATIPYFDDPRIAVVQTPQDFYNLDSFEHVGAFSEEGLFYRVLQPGKNRWDAAFWCGTSAVLRTRALRTINGVATDSVTEDLLTTIRLLDRGWGTTFHNEVLARGQAPATYRQYLIQRRRWATGAMQVLRGPDNPWRTKNLTTPQKIAFTASLAGWFEGLRTLGYLGVAVWTVLLGSLPVSADPWTFAIAHVLVFVAGQASMHVIGGRHHRLVPALIFEFLRIPVALSAAKQLVLGTERGFAVTPKGRTGDDRVSGDVPPALAVVLVMALGAWLLFVFRGIGIMTGPTGPAVGLGALALLANLGIVLAAINRIRAEDFADERRRTRRFGRSLRARITERELILERPSLAGAVVSQPVALGADVAVVMTREGPLALRGKIELTENEDQVFAFASGQWAAKAVLARTLFSEDIDTAIPATTPKVRVHQVPEPNEMPERVVHHRRSEDVAPPVPWLPPTPEPVDVSTGGTPALAWLADALPAPAAAGAAGAVGVAPAPSSPPPTATPPPAAPPIPPAPASGPAPGTPARPAPRRTRPAPPTHRGPGGPAGPATPAPNAVSGVDRPAPRNRPAPPQRRSDRPPPPPPPAS